MSKKSIKKSNSIKKVSNIHNIHFELIPLRDVVLEDFSSLIGEAQLLDSLSLRYACHYNLKGDVSGHLFVHDWTKIMGSINCKPYKIRAKVLKDKDETIAEKEYSVSTYKEAKDAILETKKFLAEYVDDPRLNHLK